MQNLSASPAVPPSPPRAFRTVVTLAALLGGCARDPKGEEAPGEDGDRGPEPHRVVDEAQPDEERQGDEEIGRAHV